MSHLFKNQPSKDILSRYPDSKYTILRIPYVNLKTPESIILQVLNAEEVDKIDSIHIKWATAIFHKLNWSAKNDLMRMSQKFDHKTWKFGVNFELYIKNVMEKHLVVIIDENTNEERFGSAKILEDLHKDFVEGMIRFFLDDCNKDGMEEIEEMILRKDIHSYLSYWRKVGSDNQLDQLSISGKEPPMCPSIIIESDMAEKYGWTLEYIRSLSSKDIKALQIVNDQRSINQFESDIKNRIVGSGGSGLNSFSAGGEAYRKVSLKEQKELMQDQPDLIIAPNLSESEELKEPEKESSTVQSEPSQPSMIEQFIQKRQIKRI